MRPLALSVAIFVITALLPSRTTGAIHTFQQQQRFPPNTLSDSSKMPPDNFAHSDAFQKPRKSGNIGVIYDSGGIDKEFQSELAKAVFVSLRSSDSINDLNPQFIDIAKVDEDDVPPVVPKSTKLDIVSQWLLRNKTSTVVCLLPSDGLTNLVSSFDRTVLVNKKRDFPPDLFTVISPRLILPSVHTDNVQVKVLSMQMKPRAVATAVMSRVQKFGIQVLIPVLDRNVPSQIEFFNHFVASGADRLSPITFTNPIYIDDPAHLEAFSKILNEYGNGVNEEGFTEHQSLLNHIRPQKAFNSSKIGVLMLASTGSRAAMSLAGQKKHMQIGWFSPNILDHEEWAYDHVDHQDDSSSANNSTAANNTVSHINGNVVVPSSSSSSDSPHEYAELLSDLNPLFGLYTVNYAGSFGWDNPERRKMLRELTSYAGANPRILTSILAHDAAWIAVQTVRNNKNPSSSSLTGLSGEIIFDEEGYRRDGVFFGVSAVPDLSSQNVTLLQPSTWILEDTIAVTETLEKQFYIREEVVSTATILHADDLRHIADKSKKDVGCVEHIMNVITHDPYNQMAYNYYFKESSLPQSMLLPHQHGFGFSFFCIHPNDNDETTSTTSPPPTNDTERENHDDDDVLTTSNMQIACTPDTKPSHPLKCFRTNVARRQRRSAAELPTSQYGIENNRQSWYQYNNNNNNNRWAQPKENSQNDYYYQFPNYNAYGGTATATTPLYLRRQDTSVAAAAEVSTTPAPSPTSKLPELRQILKAAKPFVGSCVGSTTGCAMCVLVLGRLPLGAVPAACTGPCFVGTFGSCGSLLGRVFSETTIICTELWKQGYMDMETFLADSAFGQVMEKTHPRTLTGYHILATPLVEAMKRSAVVTHIVSFFALPWAHHMRFIMGVSSESSPLGFAIHSLGFPLCTIVGNTAELISQLSSNLSLSPFTLSLWLILITVFISIMKQQRKRSLRNDDDDKNVCRSLIHDKALNGDGNDQTCFVVQTLLQSFLLWRRKAAV